jgi:translation initiation factor 2 alpha subunit (eIF-2alpha)
MFLDRMGEEERATYLQEIKDAWVQSLQKYVLMKHICTVKSIDIDREAWLAEWEVEQKIYDSLS